MHGTSLGEIVQGRNSKIGHAEARSSRSSATASYVSQVSTVTSSEAHLWYRQVKPASRAQRALIPSQIPGAILIARYRQRQEDFIEWSSTTYHDARAGKHLPKTGRRVPRERAFEEVLGVETRVVVGRRCGQATRHRHYLSRRLLVCLFNIGHRGSSSRLRSLDNGRAVSGVAVAEEIEAGHFYKGKG